MIAAAVRSARLLSGVWLGLLCWGVSSAWAVEVPDDERQRAERLADEAQAAEEAGRHREATRLLQRAVRWDPTRIDDCRRVVAWLEPIEPLAALRYADRLLVTDAEYGLDNPTQLMRLRTLANELANVETGPIAVRLSRRLVEWGEQENRLKPAQLANEWNRAGREAYRTLDLHAASEAFDQVQRLALAHPTAIDRSDPSWEVMAAVHLEAKRVDRASVSISLLVDQEGETFDSCVLQSQVALALGEPLTAIDHAERAVELAPAQIPRVMPPRSPYPVLVEAYRQINEAERAVDALEELRVARPRDTKLAIALAEQLAQHDRRTDGWKRLRAEVERLLRVSKPTEDDSASPEASRRHRDRQRRLGEAFAAWIPLTHTAEEAAAVLALAPSVIDRIDGMIALAEPFESFLAAEEVREAASAWLEDSPDEDAVSPGWRRARLALAFAAEDNELAAEWVKQRVERLRREEASIEALDAEFFDAYYTLLDRNAAAPARDLMRWMRETSLASGATEPTRDARFASELAYAIALAAPAEGPQRAEELAEVIRLADEATRLAPDAFEATLDAYYALRKAGEVDRALEAGERLLKRWPTPSAVEGVGPLWHRGLVNTLARSYEARQAEADVDRAIELDELLLDQDPNDDLPLNSLAYAFALRGEGLARAERMARRAIELQPTDPNYYDTHGWVLHRLGRHQESRRVLSAGLARATEVTPKFVHDALHEHLAAVDRALGLAEEAEAEAAP